MRRRTEKQRAEFWYGTAPLVYIVSAGVLVVAAVAFLPAFLPDAWALALVAVCVVAPMAPIELVSRWRHRQFMRAIAERGPICE